ncbi:MAG: hypothetical protein WBH28_02980 [Fuerstiella sp.]
MASSRIVACSASEKKPTGANFEVASLFAILHDSRRINEVTDPGHGPRAAQFASELRGNLFDLDDHEFSLLYRACEGHTYERTHPVTTIQTCWDSDRLDLGELGSLRIPVNYVLKWQKQKR